MSDTPAGIDPRGPRFAATITSVLLAITVVLGLTGLSAARLEGDASFGWFAYAPLPDAISLPGGFILPAIPVEHRIADWGFVALFVVVALFAWSVISPRTAPWGALFRTVVAPKLAKPTEWEDARPVRFAQSVGFTITAIGLVLHVVGVPLAIPIAAGIAFIAAFLNAAFGFCLGCQMYLLLQRLKPRPAA